MTAKKGDNGYTKELDLLTSFLVLITYISFGISVQWDAKITALFDISVIYSIFYVILEIRTLRKKLRL